MCENYHEIESIPSAAVFEPRIQRRGNNGRRAHPIIRYAADSGVKQLYLDLLSLEEVHPLVGTECSIDLDYGFYESESAEVVIERYDVRINGDGAFVSGSTPLQQLFAAKECQIFRCVSRDGEFVSRWYRRVGPHSQDVLLQRKTAAVLGRTRKDRAQRLNALGRVSSAN